MGLFGVIFLAHLTTGLFGLRSRKQQYLPSRSASKNRRSGQNVESEIRFSNEKLIDDLEKLYVDAIDKSSALEFRMGHQEKHNKNETKDEKTDLLASTKSQQSFTSKPFPDIFTVLRIGLSNTSQSSLQRLNGTLENDWEDAIEISEAEWKTDLLEKNSSEMNSDKAQLLFRSIVNSKTTSNIRTVEVVPRF